LSNQLRRDLKHLTSLSFYLTTDHLYLDATTLRHLEIVEPLHRDAARQACLYGVLNRTVTPMGARLLREWLTQPLANTDAIARRQEVVQAWIDQPQALARFREALTEVRDLERTLGRLSTGTGNARDLVALRLGLQQIPTLQAILAELVRRLQTPSPQGCLHDLAPSLPPTTPASPSLLIELVEQLTDLPALVELINRAIVDDPPLALKEGGIIRDGFDPALDELRRATREGKDWIARLQQQEIHRTGIPSLKVRFNSVFGYYIEVTKAHLDKVPPDYIRKQTIAGGERFVTPALKEMEGKILGAEERSMKLEYELFLQVREQVLAHLKPLQRNAAALAQLDVLATFAEVARLHNYCRPQVGDEGILHIRDGRHPVLEQTLTDERFVPNDVALAAATAHCARATGSDSATAGPGPGQATEAAPASASQPLGDDSAPSGAQADVPRSDSNAAAFPQIALITGPNMAGKSTYIRQVALLTLLAHTGSFIPASQARIDLVDRIFTRIGASDDLARGQSTFMVEMTETANILHHATPRSLIILDEIGRGTSTFDGLALAWSIVEYIHNQIGAKTLFATHYHELTELAARLPRLKNYNVAVREWHDQVVFLRKIVEGGSDKSYGIQVARLAGVPKPVIERAKVILANLEESELRPDGTVRRSPRRQRDRDALKQLEPPPQLDLFG
jgi:DNA mismatch repair protein MutS